MKIVGHRGARGEAPENTLAGIQHCFDIDVYDFEIDIRLSGDNNFMLMHDASLTRTCDSKQMLHETHSKKLSSISANQDRSADYFTNKAWQKEHKNICIPSLDQVLTLAKDSAKKNQACSFQLEIKSDEHTSESAILKKITNEFTKSRIKRLASNIVFTSFDGDIIREISAQAPHLNTGIISHENAIEAIQLATKLNCTHCCLNYKLLLDANNELKKQLRESEMHISVWTLNDVELIAELEQLGVSSIITDYPSQFIAKVNR